jgi:uncharacterized membrane protein YiaA
MDIHNRFHTEQTFRWVRAEHLALMVGLSLLGGFHLREIHWGHFIAAFVIIDLVGYIPGAVAFRKSGGKKIDAIYYNLYNFTHSYLICGCAVGLWALALGRLEWAMIAVPIHLSGDRGLFGNTYKPISLPFEPMPPVDSTVTSAVSSAGALTTAEES